MSTTVRLDNLGIRRFNTSLKRLDTNELYVEGRKIESYGLLSIRNQVDVAGTPLGAHTTLTATGVSFVAGKKRLIKVMGIVDTCSRSVVSYTIGGTLHQTNPLEVYGAGLLSGFSTATFSAIQPIDSVVLGIAGPALNILSSSWTGSFPFLSFGGTTDMPGEVIVNWTGGGSVSLYADTSEIIHLPFSDVFEYVPTVTGVADVVVKLQDSRSLGGYFNRAAQYKNAAMLII